MKRGIPVVIAVVCSVGMACAALLVSPRPTLPDPDGPGRCAVACAGIDLRAGAFVEAIPPSPVEQR
jgi:hypothetical protein